MASTATPYGLRPIALIGGQPFAGSTRMVRIASGYNVNIFNGDIVAIDGTTGTLVKVTATGADGTTNAFPAGTIGVFLGTEYTDPNLRYLLQRQNWIAGTVAPDAKAYVCMDPDTLFQVQASGSVPQAALGANISVVQNAGSLATGNSAVAANAAGVGTETFRPFRIVDFVDSTSSTVGDAFTDIIVKFNEGIHSFTNPTGV